MLSSLAPSRADSWLLPVLRSLLDPSLVDELTRTAAGRLWDAAVARGGLADGELLEAAAAHLRLPVADFRQATTQAVELVPERWARKFRVVPLRASDDRLRIATADPFDMDCERTLAFATGRQIEMALASPDEIALRIDELYRGEAQVREPERLLEVELLTAELETAPSSAGDDDPASTTRLVDDLIGAGIAARASDIHIEPDEQGIGVRHRIDGVLHLARRLPRAVGPALVSRIKIMSRLDIADRLRPQDGRARVAVNGVPVDLRVSTLPASHGEKVVLRVLDSRTTVMTLDAMGFNPDELHRVQRLLQVREGLILVTGPTGSGKTTTLYAALRQIAERGVNIVTVEDPIEYRLPGIVQVQVHERAGLTFASALRSIMRQDPDVLLVGEIRDRETAEIAIQASLTGHLVLSTLHTNDAASAVTRLADIGVESYKIATALKGVVAQRLVRRLCPECAGKGGGCETCSGTGYRGRLAIVEVLVSSPEFERLVAAGSSVERIAEAGRAAGADGEGESAVAAGRSLWLSGLEHVRAGRTSMSELRRVTAPAVATPERFHYLPQRSSARIPDRQENAVAQLSIGSIDLYVVRPRPDGWRVLVLQRAPDTRCPTAWESVHGHIEPGEEPEDAAVRELREETGLEIARLYNVTVQPFYLHKTHTILVAVVFAAFVDEPGDVVLGPEHQGYEWLDISAALERFHWPRESEALQQIVRLLRGGDAGPVEDVLRVI